MTYKLSSSWITVITRWLNLRLPLYTQAVSNLKRQEVPRKRNYWCYYLGGLTLGAFLVQIVTGILLMFYYQPSMVLADQSVNFIVRAVPDGFLIRNIHAWSANLLMAFLFLHALTAALMRSYRNPRELTWVTGVLALLIIMGEAFSGSLLPCNALAVNATKVGVSIMRVSAAMLPGILSDWGQSVLNVALGPGGIGQDVLSRFFTMHVIVFPLLLIFLIAIHLLFVYMHGLSGQELPAPMSASPRIEAQSTERKEPELKAMARTERVFPTFLLKNAAVWMLAFSLLLILAIILPHDSLRPYTMLEGYDPLAPAPNGIKPEWYFYFLFYPIGIFPRSLVIVSSTLFFMALFCTPWLMEAIPRLWGVEGKKSQFPIWAALAVAQFLLIFTIFGAQIEHLAKGAHFR